MSEKNADGT